MTAQDVRHVARESWLETVTSLRGEGFTMLTDLTAVDHLSNSTRVLPDDIAPERFEVVASLLDMNARARLRLRAQVPASDPTIASLFSVHPGCEALEREVFDMFGITFEDHPDLTRILMPEDWEGFPLRKDYAMGRIPVQFKEAGKPQPGVAS
ncbi:MAG: NADH-quinone oxidoreductase subunit [Actinomycetota bacterium]